MTARPNQWYDKNPQAPQAKINAEKYGFYLSSESCSKDIKSPASWIFNIATKCTGTYSLKLKLVCESTGDILKVSSPLRFQEFDVVIRFQNWSGEGSQIVLKGRTNHEGEWLTTFEKTEDIHQAAAKLMYKEKEYSIPFGEKISEISVGDLPCGERAK